MLDNQGGTDVSGPNDPYPSWAGVNPQVRRMDDLERERDTARLHVAAAAERYGVVCEERDHFRNMWRQTEALASGYRSHLNTALVALVAALIGFAAAMAAVILG